MQIGVVHDKIPGRMRLRSPELYRSSAVKRQIESTLSAMDAVQSYRVNELTAQVLLNYSPSLSAQELLGQLQEKFAQSSSRIDEQSPQQARPTPNQVQAAHTQASDRPGQAEATESGASNWHSQTPAQIAQRLQSDLENGLSAKEAKARLRRYGGNRIAQAEGRSDRAILLQQFKSLPVGMLGASALLSFFTGGRVDAGVIMGVVAANAGIGFYTERQAERTIASLDSTAPARVEVFRGGKLVKVPYDDVVPGDLLRLSPGSVVAADARIVSALRLTVDESALTGESLPASKRAADELPPETPVRDRDNMVYMGTMVTGGSASALVVQTGSRTELGRIQSLVETAQSPQTPMERQLGHLSTQLGVLSGAVCAGIFALGLLRGQPRLQMLKSAVSLAVAAVPEGLPAVATTTLAFGIRELRKRGVSVRQIEAVETLGSLQTLCLDKTGTLTRNRMSVVATRTLAHNLTVENGRFRMRDQQGSEIEVGFNQAPELKRLLEVICLCSEAESEDGRLTGSPTETALLELAVSNGIDVTAFRKAHRQLEVRQRAQDRPLMSTTHELDGNRLIAVKGRPEEMLARCTHKQLNGELEPLSDADRQSIVEANSEMAGRALRVLAVAYKRVENGEKTGAEDLVWLGLVGLQDPLREGMPELIREYQRAGIRTVLITGDQGATARAIGEELNISGNDQLQVLDAIELENMDEHQLAERIREVNVFARVSPAHKLRIVQALQESGQVVGMTGDGINDGPALKAADVGIAMGRSGSDVARRVADVVVDEDDLQTISTSIRQGRTIYANIRKTIHYLLSTNFSEIEVMLAGIASGLGQPLNPRQLLWINLVSDIFPGLALSFEAPAENVMQQAPRPTDEPIIRNTKLGTMALESAVITAGTMAAYVFGRMRGGSERASTLAFHTLTSAQLLHAISCRSEHHSIFDPGHRPRNKHLEIALAGTAAGQLLIATVPPLRRLLGVGPVGVLDLFVVAGGATLPLLTNEYFKSKRQRNGGNGEEGRSVAKPVPVVIH